MKKTKLLESLQLRAENDLAFYKNGLLSKADLKDKTKIYRKKANIEFNYFIGAQ